MEKRERELEAELLARQLGMSVEEVPDMLADDRLDYMPPAVLRRIAEEELTRSKAEIEAEEEVVKGQSPGSLYVRSTLEAYVAAVLLLYDQLKQDKLNPHPHPRGSALEGLLQRRARERDKNDRESFADRGEGGIAAGYTAAVLLQMMEVMLSGLAQSPKVSIYSFSVVTFFFLNLQKIKRIKKRYNQFHLIFQTKKLRISL